MIVLRKVRLPDADVIWIESEEHIIGGSETQLCYSYVDSLSGEDVDKSPYITDYWGRIEDLEEVA